MIAIVVNHFPIITRVRFVVIANCGFHHMCWIIVFFAHPALFVVGVATFIVCSSACLNKKVIRLIFAYHQALVFDRPMMVNALRRFQRSAKRLLRHKDMLVFVTLRALSFSQPNHGITARANCFSTLPLMVKRTPLIMAANVVSGFTLFVTQYSSCILADFGFLPAPAMAKTVWNFRGVRGIIRFSLHVLSLLQNVWVRAAVTPLTSCGSFFCITNECRVQ